MGRVIVLHGLSAWAFPADQVKAPGGGFELSATYVGYIPVLDSADRILSENLF
jgi:hypothetical protein